MRKLISTILFAILGFSALAQQSANGTLKFLGIPVDGPKEEMIEKIKEKGFQYNSYWDCLTGQFNGQNVSISVVENHGTTYRVHVLFHKTTENRIRFDYNLLFTQFLRNDKYVQIGDYEEISDEEDISYEMDVHNKNYYASFAYISPDIFSKEESELIHKIMEKTRAMNPDETTSLNDALFDSLNSDIDPSSVNKMLEALKRIKSILSGNVWFTIIRNGSDYRIGLYYDNVENMPNGEDL